MKKTILTLTIGLLLAGASALYAAVETGQPAPDFTLTDTKGATHTLSQHKGQYVVLEWLNHDCPFVKKHYNSGNMQALQKEYTGKGIVWISINSSAEGKEGYSTPDIADALTKEKNAAPTAVLLDKDGNVGKQYGAQTTPHMYVINPEGILIYQGAIDSKASADPNDIPSSTNYVKAALDQSMGGQQVAEASTKSYGCSVKY